ncbi:hypothetical protein CDD81_2004 [Ophiocordyceps australis]|uniref:Uncharacterized protein n=1 Tax=Ophiocordyceps australis TaxID=1399860 RepID=A0A2C5XB46_9HYPO|nr:hypothetical protein CDD81_2004 [Ophiocordyceps australis]
MNLVHFFLLASAAWHTNARPNAVSSQAPRPQISASRHDAGTKHLARHTLLAATPTKTPNLILPRQDLPAYITTAPTPDPLADQGYRQETYYSCYTQPPHSTPHCGWHVPIVWAGARGTAPSWAMLELALLHVLVAAAGF